jgi:LacI family transcriptional regulator
MNLTLKDIARALEISTSTVSKALKNYKDVSPTTKKKVLDYAERIGFKPNAQAAFLRTQKTKLIGVILPKIEHDLYCEVLKGILNKMSQTDYKLILLCSENSFEIEKKHIRELLQLNVDGIFISIALETNRFDHLKEVQKSNTILVLFDHYVKIIATNRVLIEDRKASFLATEHLIQQGCQKIGCFRGELISQTSIDRFMGYKDALEYYKIPFQKELILICNEETIAEGKRNMIEILEKKLEIDGLVTVTDLIALGAMDVLKQRRVKIPEEIAVVGFGNWKFTSLISPSLSTIDQNGFLMGEKVFELFQKSQDDTLLNELPNTEILPFQLVVRGSSCRKK